MTRSDLLIKLVKAGSSGDKVMFRSTVEAIIAEERSKKHHIIADRLSEVFQTRFSSSPSLDKSDERVNSMVSEMSPRRVLDDLVIPSYVRRECDDLIEEQMRVELLRSYSLEPRHKVLLTGPPGNGKTSIAEAIATALMIPFFLVRYEGIIGSYLGETSTRLQRLFDYVRTNRCVLFFDEFDAIGKERGDEHETGEIKRVVSSLLLQIDRLPSHVVVIAATNHPELLDRAVWRRFQLKLELPLPQIEQIEQWLVDHQRRSGLGLHLDVVKIARELEGISFAELEEFMMSIQRRYVLRMPKANGTTIVMDALRQYPLSNRDVKRTSLED